MLTTTQKEIVNFIKSVADRGGRPPTYGEIAIGVGVAVRAIQYQLDKLEAAGVVRRRRNGTRAVPRSVEVVELCQNGENMSRQVAESGRPIVHTDLSETEIKNLKSDLDKADPLEPEMVLRVRNSLGLSQEQFGERVGAARRTVQDWEHGARACKGSARMMVIAQADLIGENEED